MTTIEQRKCPACGWQEPTYQPGDPAICPECSVEFPYRAPSRTLQRVGTPTLPDQARYDPANLVTDRVSIAPETPTPAYHLLYDGPRDEYVELCQVLTPYKSTRVYDRAIADLSDLRPCKQCAATIMRLLTQGEQTDVQWVVDRDGEGSCG